MSTNMQEFDYIVGVDEVGRGPLAGPVAVGAVAVPRGFDWELLPGVNDSKKVSPEDREAIFRRAKELQKRGELNFAVSMISAAVIDRIGITKSVERALSRALARLELDPATTFVKLDGLLHAPPTFIHQETIIKGDVSEKEISLASIVAKVTRDRYMVRVSKRYPNYAFEIHKGYGTKQHCAAISTWKLSAIHRQSFCTRLMQKGI